MVDSILSKLVENSEVKCHKGKYYLSSTKKNKITKALQESQERIEYIIDKYFVPFYSSKEAITLWFKNVLLYFFENYSQTWVADLCYHKNNVCNNIDSIVSTLERRIRNHKEIDERDYKRISDYLPINEQAYSLCGERGEQNQRVFEGLTGSSWISRPLKKWIEASGIKKHITFHCSRHTFATLQLEHDTDIYTIKGMLGHTNVKTTQIYAHIVDKSKRNAADVIHIDNLDAVDASKESVATI